MHGPLNVKIIVKYIFIYICKTRLLDDLRDLLPFPPQIYGSSVVLICH